MSASITAEDVPMSELKPVHYPGNLTAELPGRILGPDAWGGYIVVVIATFDPETRQTTAWWRPATPEQMAERVYDRFGQAFLLSLITDQVRTEIPMVGI